MKLLPRKNYYKPSEIAQALNRSVRTIQNYCDNGDIRTERSKGNQRRITLEALEEYTRTHDLNILESPVTQPRNDAIYARVSTNRQTETGDLDRQITACKIYAADHNPHNLQTYTDTASGLNDNRKGLNQLLKQVQDNKINRIFITYKDRLTRFGYAYLKRICDEHGTEIVTINTDPNKSSEYELTEDMISLMHSFSGRLYGMRSHKNTKQNN